MNTVSRRRFIKTAAAAMPAVMVGSCLHDAREGEKKPNIVFIFADQMRAQAMGCMGNDQVITPHLDELAKESLLVTNAIACQPVCSPFRAQLLTGRHSHATGVIHNDIKLPNDEITIAEVLKNNGYATGYIGKWHLAGHRENPVPKEDRQGWDFWAVRNCSHDHSHPEYWLNDAKEPACVEGWEPDVQTDLAVEYIKKNGSHPFCLFVSFGPPHPPYSAPLNYLNMYKGRPLTLRPNVLREKFTTLVQYYAMVTSLDVCVGRISRALDEAGIADNTILCFTSDHGDMLGSQGHVWKQRPWEESINIPFILRYPNKIKAGQRRDWIVSSVDVMPTLLGFCGASIPGNVQGMDLSDAFCGQSDKEREAAFLFNVDIGNGPGSDWRGIRTKKWVYAFHAKGDWLLYDLEKDPYQLHNLINDPEHAEQKARLRKQLDTMRKALGESMPLKGGYPDPIRLPTERDGEVEDK